MKDLTPPKSTLDPIEIASRDEIQALQLKRLKWSLRHAYGYGLFTGVLGIHLGADALGLSTVPISGGMTPRQVRLINDFRPNGITVTPSYALSILDEFTEQGLDPRDTSLDVGIFGAEPWTNAMRHEIEQAFDLHAIDIYGLSEIMGPGVANECVETKEGLHIWEDHFFPEIINPDTGEIFTDGEQGELVFTSLTKESFPIIRYHTRDLTCLLPGTARSMRRTEKVTGRSDDMIILRGANVFPTQIEEALMAIPNLDPHFQIELSRPDRMDQMRVITEVIDEAVGQSARQDAGKMLMSSVKQSIGISVEIEILDVGGVPRSEGKAVRIIDNRPKA